MTKISIVSGICLLPDAISYSAVEKVEALSGFGRDKVDVRLFSHNSNWDDDRSITVKDPAELAANKFFRSSDAVCYEFGIHYSLFDTIFLLPQEVAKVAVYHNITPLKFAFTDEGRHTIESGLRQRANLLYCDRIACDSEYNLEELREFGIPDERLQVLNLPLKAPFECEPAPLPKASTPVEILFVGRFVRSKGVLDLVRAAAECIERSPVAIRVRLVGDTAFSDAAYLREINRAIQESESPESFEYVGSVSPEGLFEHYQRAHILAIASYHEGYCLPVIEGLSCGCVVVAYDGGNLPYIVNGLGRVVPAGDQRALANALIELSLAVSDDAVAPEDRTLPLDCGRISAQQFQDRSRAYLSRFSVDAYHQEVRSLFARLKAPGLPSIASYEPATNGAGTQAERRPTNGNRTTNEGGEVRLGNILEDK